MTFLHKLKNLIKSNNTMFNIYKFLSKKYYLMTVAACKKNIYFLESSNKIKKMKDIHKGRRCFIIGNGPSLTVQDLEKLKNEITFGSNKIFVISSESEFRPYYYFSQDDCVIKELVNDDPYCFNNICAKKIFLPIDVKLMGIPYFNDILYFYITRKNSYPYQPKFSNNVSKKVHEGLTVTYTAIQFAAYMGFKVIYLIGIDHNYSNVITPDGNIIKNNNVKDYFSEKYKYKSQMHPANLYMSELAFKAAKDYCKKNSIKIYNATRGGKLEVFERVDFDTLFNTCNN